MEGALFAKYLSWDEPENGSNKVVRYGSALLLGMYSHLVSDHFGNFEPRTGSQEMIYFSAEGIVDMVLLFPQWKKDPRLFWGSLGGMLPDIEHSLRLFGRRVFPTHSGVVTHGELEVFWHGAVENLILEGIAYYAICKEMSSTRDGSPAVRVWDGC
jgi:hypothetical protein